MKKFVQARLSGMMFLEFFVWGAWYTAIAVYMSNNGMEDLTHWPFTVNPIAAICAPFFVGLIADRYFATERVLGTLHILGGIIMGLTPLAVNNPLVFILMLLAYNLCYMPTMSLSNTLAFHNIQDQEKEFPVIRVFGTVGWIVAGLTVSFGLVSFVSEGITPEATALPLYLTSIASIILGLYSFTLPHTPPPAKGETVSVRSIVGVDALKQLGSKSFYIFLASSLLISIPLAAYYNFTQIFLGNAGFQNIAATQTIGQASEVLFMLLMPFFFARLGVKWMLGVGMLAWALRYALFALGAPDVTTWMILGGIALHGICYDFFFVTGQIYVDIKSFEKIRGQAQGLIVLITYGVGMLIGAQVAGETFNLFLGEQSALTLDQWYDFWWLPGAFAVVVFLIFIFTFNDREAEGQVSEEDISPL
ncbi:MFS transporter [Rhodohalobacter sulfatireducens]|uniref:MFS transporter n=1 Tax=Rhodohalobacter sulfatireducens TaxID=2911366 RepID=A0ABS9KCZ3_9BACT|nr:MFS transporter [Rhodohalobacter sulfatireducens]MCG2588711.1 MFS transporter [Rhodohalobacter sulfatireducens]